MKSERVMIAGSDPNDWCVFVGTTVVVEGLTEVEARAIEKFAEELKRDFVVVEKAKFHDVEKLFRDDE